MILKKYSDFIIKESSKEGLVNGCFTVTEKMVTNGKFNTQMPIIVERYFDCSRLELTTLEGCPESVGGQFDCSYNNLTNLEGCPKLVGGIFTCNYNNELISLKGCSTYVEGDFYVKTASLISLEYAPLESKKIYTVSEHLSIEKEFLESGKCTSTDPTNYWNQLLRWMIEEKKDFKDVSGWPEGFLTEDLIKSVSGILKYKL